MTLYIGEPLLDPQLVQYCFKEAGVEIDVRTHRNANTREVEWCRDQTVARVDGTHLIGFRDFDEHLLLTSTLIPLYFENPEELDRTNLMSEGIMRSMAVNRKIVHFLKENGIPHRPSHCAFDGGNVFLYPSQEGKPRAIVGFNSVIHTFLALRVQKFYERCKERLEFEVSEPSTEAYYVARNLALHEKYKDYAYRCYRKTRTTQDSVIEQEYNTALKKIITPEEKGQFRVAAIEIEKQLQIAKEEIGNELGIDDPIFVPQRQFHIDLDLLPLKGKNVVFYHCDRLSASYSEKLERILLAHGLIPKPVYAVGEIAGVKCNLMNALQVENVIMLPAPHTYFEKIDARFRAALKKEGMEVVSIPLPRDTITQFSGGLHCFTLEVPK